MRELGRAGKRRRQYLQSAEDEMPRIAELAAAAIEEGHTVAETARVAQISRVTLYQIVDVPTALERGRRR